MDLVLEPWFFKCGLCPGAPWGYAESRPGHTDIVPSIIFWECAAALPRKPPDVWPHRHPHSKWDVCVSFKYGK